MNRKRVFWASVLIAALYGEATGFSLSWEWLPWALSVAAITAMVAIPMLTHAGYLRVKRADSKSTVAYVGKWIVIFIFGFMVCGLIFCRAMPAAGTYVLAKSERVSVEVAVGKNWRHRRRGFRTRLLTSPHRLWVTLADGSAEAQFSLDEELFPYFERKRALTFARIRRSWFGMHVLEIEPTSDSTGSTPQIYP